jgi:hypothetical protein
VDDDAAPLGAGRRGSQRDLLRHHAARHEGRGRLAQDRRDLLLQLLDDSAGAVGVELPSGGISPRKSAAVGEPPEWMKRVQDALSARTSAGVSSALIETTITGVDSWP